MRRCDFNAVAQRTRAENGEYNRLLLDIEPDLVARRIFFDESNFSKPRDSASFCENAVISRSVLFSSRKLL